METRIGTSLKTTPGTLWFLAATGLLVMSIDLTLAATGHWHTYYRLTLAIIASLAYGFAEGHNRWDESPLGFRSMPRQGWIYWVKAAAILGILVFAILGILSFVGLVILGYGIPDTHLYVTESTRLPYLFVSMCIIAPVSEEVLYRLALSAPAVALIGPRWTIIVGGLSFASLHSLQGIPSPENLLGGFILTWAFLKSETLLVPIALHALGNLGAFAFQVGFFYWLS